jgi:hypothetical protein
VQVILPPPPPAASGPGVQKDRVPLPRPAANLQLEVSRRRAAGRSKQALRPAPQIQPAAEDRRRERRSWSHTDRTADLQAPGRIGPPDAVRGLVQPRNSIFAQELVHLRKTYGHVPSRGSQCEPSRWGLVTKPGTNPRGQLLAVGKEVVFRYLKDAKRELCFCVCG